ncbi:MAG: hypothetical protein ABI446_08295 [Gemmatimonadaceae bacterium]
MAAIVATALLPAAARAQTVLGYGEDATAAPVGAIRIRLSNDWDRSRAINSLKAMSGEIDTSYDTDRQSRASTIGLEVGVLKRFSVGVTVPWVTTKALTFLSSRHVHDTTTGLFLDTLLETSHNGWGNVEMLGRIVWLGEPGQQARLAPRDGIHVRSTIVGGAFLGTGIKVDPTDPFAIGTSDRARSLVGESATDLTVGTHFFGSFVGRYEKPMSDNVVVALHPSGNPFANDGVPLTAARELGTKYEIEITPRYQFGRYFAVGMQYRYHHGAQDHYTGQTTGTDNDGNEVALDASTLDAGTELTEQRVGFGVVYSGVDAYTHNRSRIPVEVTFQYSRVVSISNDLPKISQVTFAVRLFHRMWGKEFAPPKIVKTAPALEPEPAPAPKHATPPTPAPPKP